MLHGLCRLIRFLSRGGIGLDVSQMAALVKTEVSKGVAWVKMCRTEALNAIDVETARQLYEALRACAKDSGVRVVVLIGEGRIFCPGGDVKAMHAAADKGLFLRDLTKSIHLAVLEIRRMKKPVIAAIHGAAAGAGLGIALSCDLIVAEERTKLNTAFINLGAAPGCGTFFLVNAVGEKRAKELLMFNKTLTAEEARDLGMVVAITKIGELRKEAERLALELAAGPGLALASAKELVNRAMATTLETQLELESLALSHSGESADFKEGVQAFVEKRKPTFQGK